MITNEEYVNYLREDWGVEEKNSKEIVKILIIKLKNHYSFTSGKYVLYSLLSNAIKEYQECDNMAQYHIFLERISGHLNNHCKILLEYTINKQKESKMSEFVLTEDISLYQFRNKPNREIIEILIPKNEGAKKLRFPIRVFYKENDRFDWLNYNLDGKYSTWESDQDADIILKPQKKFRPFTHEEILDLRKQWAVFRGDGWSGISYVSLLGMSCEHYTFSSAVSASYFTLVKEYKYSLDDGKTWHKLEKEVNNG